MIHYEINEQSKVKPIDLPWRAHAEFKISCNLIVYVRAWK